MYTSFNKKKTEIETQGMNVMLFWENKVEKAFKL